MSDPTAQMTLAAAAMLAMVVAVAALLRAWQGWLDLKRAEIASRRPMATAPRRIEMADLRDRVRRLEAIADGADS